MPRDVPFGGRMLGRSSPTPGDADADWRNQRPRRIEHVLAEKQIPCPAIVRRYGLTTICGADDSGYFAGHAGLHRGER